MSVAWITGRAIDQSTPPEVRRNFTKNSLRESMNTSSRDCQRSESSRPVGVGPPESSKPFVSTQLIDDEAYDAPNGHRTAQRGGQPGRRRTRQPAIRLGRRRQDAELVPFGLTRTAMELRVVDGTVSLQPLD